MIDPKVLRIGNWMHCKGSSHYGVVTGDILAEMERDEKFREKFEPIVLTDDLLLSIGFEKRGNGIIRKGIFCLSKWDDKYFWCDVYGVDLFPKNGFTTDLHTLQNKYFYLMNEELPLPESAKIIPQVLEK